MEKVKRESLILYASICNLVKQLPPMERLKVYEAIIDYGLDGDETDLGDGLNGAIFGVAKPLIDANNRRYLKSVKAAQAREQMQEYSTSQWGAVLSSDAEGCEYACDYAVICNNASNGVATSRKTSKRVENRGTVTQNGETRRNKSQNAEKAQSAPTQSSAVLSSNTDYTEQVSAAPVEVQNSESRVRTRTYAPVNVNVNVNANVNEHVNENDNENVNENEKEINADLNESVRGDYVTPISACAMCAHDRRVSARASTQLEEIFDGGDCLSCRDKSCPPLCNSLCPYNRLYSLATDRERRYNRPAYRSSLSSANAATSPLVGEALYTDSNLLPTDKGSPSSGKLAPSRRLKGRIETTYDRFPSLPLRTAVTPKSWTEK